MSKIVRELRWSLRDLFKNGLFASALFPAPIRRHVLRLAGVKSGKCHIYPRVFIGSGPLVIGDGVAINRECFLDATGGIWIGDNSRLGPRVTVITVSHTVGGTEATRTRRTKEDEVISGVRIGDNVWIGAGSTLLPGVSIGNGSVVAAGSVVNRDCPPNGLYAGVPAKRIRDLPE